MEQPTGTEACRRRISFWQVMQYEGIMDSLQDAIEKNEIPEIHRLVRDLQAAPKCTTEAEALLETGRYNRAARERLIEICTNQFSTQPLLDEAACAQGNIQEPAFPQPPQKGDACIKKSEKVLKYEGLLDSLSGAMERKNAAEADRLMQAAREAYKQLEDANEDAVRLEPPEEDDAFMKRSEKPIKKSKKCPPSDSQWVWQVMKYEGLLDGLSGAIGRNDAPEARRLMQDVRDAYKQLEDVDEVTELLEEGRWNFVARQNISEVYANQFGSRDSSEVQEDPSPSESAIDIRKDPFYTEPPRGPTHLPPRVTGIRRDYVPKMMTLSSYATSVRQPILDASGIFKGAVDNGQLCRQNTTDLQAAGLAPLNHFLRSDSPTTMEKLCNVLKLRGGGLPSCGLDYGSCGTNLCDPRIPFKSSSKPTKADKAAFLQHMQEPYVPAKHSLVSRVNAFLDEPIIAFGLITVDLLASTVNSFLPWLGWTVLGLTMLSLMVLQQVLEIYLNSSLVDKEIMEGETVVTKYGFWADDGNNSPHWIEVGSVGTIDSLGEAEWRHDNGAFITFEGRASCCFVSERDFIDLKITSGLYEYFMNPINDFNILILGLCCMFVFVNAKGVGGVLIVLRFLKPVLKVYGRGDKVTRLNENKEGVVGEEGAVEAEGLDKEPKAV